MSLLLPPERPQIVYRSESGDILVTDVQFAVAAVALTGLLAAGVYDFELPLSRRASLAGGQITKAIGWTEQEAAAAIERDMLLPPGPTELRELALWAMTIFEAGVLEYNLNPEPWEGQ